MIPPFLGFTPNIHDQVVCDWCATYLEYSISTGIDLCPRCVGQACVRCHKGDPGSGMLCDDCEIAEDRETADLGYAR